MGLERLNLACESEGVELPVENELDGFIVTFGEEVTSEAVKITQTLRENNIEVDKDYQRRKPKGQFKEADRVKAKYVLILGEDELEKGVITVREMTTGNQERSEEHTSEL